MFNFSVLNVFDVGFLLSYLATLGILLLAGKIGEYFSGEKMITWTFLSQEKPFNSFKMSLLSLVKYIKEMIIVSVSAQILTLPVIWIVFQEYALWSILSSVIFSILIVFVVIISVYLLLTFSIGNYLPLFQILIVEPFTFYLNLILDFFLFIFVFYTNFFSKAENFTWLPNKIMVIGYYIFWLLFVFLIRKIKRKRNLYVEKI
jgi:predicted membrane metal-binding protein